MRGLSHHFHRPRHTFALLLVTLIAAMVFQLAAPDTELSRLVAIALQAIALLAALAAAGARRRAMVAVSVAMALLIGIAALLTIGPGSVGDAIPRAMSLGLVVIAPVAVVRGLRSELREQQKVTMRTVYAGLSIYLLLGLAFAFLFALLQDVSGEPFFAPDTGAGTPANFLYFSLATLTTTGYGDFVAGTPLARSLSVSEALVGQIYLVTVVALLVSNLGRSRPLAREQR